MAGITITARVRRDGTLAIPKKARETLGLHEGDQVEITVNKSSPQAEEQGSDPLLELIGIGKGGPTYGAEDHDSRLYRHPSA
jgi:AbrB family looped-hinge helix DNA binding protein